MSLLLKNIRVQDPASGYNGQITDLFIRDGKVHSMKKSSSADQVLDMNGAWLSPGLFDMWSHFCEPGYEHKEDIHTGLAAAKWGGFTDVCTLPNTAPVVDHKSQLNFILKTASGLLPQLHPYAHVSQNGAGEVISEMRDLHENGAVAFTGGLDPISDSELLLKSLQYTGAFGGLVINRPVDRHLARHGQMHEGVMSTRLGMRGIPAMAEKLAVERDLNVLSYTNGRLHLSGISTAESVRVIREAKESGLPITCDVPVHNLMYTDEMLGTFDSNLKLDPPLRSEPDRKALIKGLLDNTIDGIASYHLPQDTESKELEFDRAECGMISLQTMIAQLIKLSEEIPVDVLLQKCSNGPRGVLGLEPIRIAEGAGVRFTVIDPDHEWVFDGSTNQSRSINSNLFGLKLMGRAIGLVIGDQYIEI